MEATRVITYFLPCGYMRVNIERNYIGEYGAKQVKPGITVGSKDV